MEDRKVVFKYYIATWSWYKTISACTFWNKILYLEKNLRIQKANGAWSLYLKPISLTNQNWLESDLDQRVYVHHLVFGLSFISQRKKKVKNLNPSLTQYTKQLHVVCHSESTVSLEIELPDENDTTLTLDDYEEKGWAFCHFRKNSFLW